MFSTLLLDNGASFINVSDFDTGVSISFVKTIAPETKANPKKMTTAIMLFFT
jgi:hypothetical protein